MAHFQRLLDSAVMTPLEHIMRRNIPVDREGVGHADAWRGQHDAQDLGKAWHKRIANIRSKYETQLMQALCSHTLRASRRRPSSGHSFRRRSRRPSRRSRRLSRPQQGAHRRLSLPRRRPRTLSSLSRSRSRSPTPTTPSLTTLPGPPSLRRCATCRQAPRKMTYVDAWQITEHALPHMPHKTAARAVFRAGL